MTQIGLALSPLSNNALFLTLSKSPFHEFFSVGMNVSLSTDDPLMFHHTREPLMEEYTIAKQVWKLSAVDLSEIARNSVLQSSFEPCVKAFWIGANYRKRGRAGNDIFRTNVPNVRLDFREVALRDEMRVVFESYTTTLIGLPQLSPTHRPISLAHIAAAHAAAKGNAEKAHALTALTPAPAALPPPVKPVRSPPRAGHAAAGTVAAGTASDSAAGDVRSSGTAAKYQRYDGPFAKDYTLEEARKHAYSPKQTRGTPGGGGGGSGGGVSGGERSRTASGRAREGLSDGWQLGDRLGAEAGAEAAPTSEARPAASADIHARLDEQQRLLLEAQALAAAAERRAQSAMGMNRVLLLATIGAAAGAVVVALRAK